MMRMIVICGIFLNLGIGLLNAEYIIKTKKANMRKEPSASSQIIYTLYQYESVKVLKVQGNWVKVKNIDGKIGWVNKSVLEKIETENINELNIKSKNKIEDTKLEEKRDENSIKQTSTPFTIIDTNDINKSDTQNHNISYSLDKNKENYSKNLNLKKYKFNDERRRVIGEHIFPSTVLFPSPVPSARFGFSEGFGMLKGYYVYPYKDPDTQEAFLTKQNINYFGFEQRFDAGIIITDNISIDLNLGVLLSGGMEDKDFTQLNASPKGDVRIGPSFSYKSDNNLLLSFAPRFYYSKSVNISAGNAINNFLEYFDKEISNPEFEELIEKYENNPSLENLFNIINSTYVKGILTNAIPSFTKSLVQNETEIGIAPSLGFAYPINKFWGIQGSVEWLRTKYKADDKVSGTETETESHLNFNIANSLDFNNIINFPLGIVFEFSREGGDPSTNNFGLGLYYQGIGDVQLGVLFNKSKLKQKGLIDISQTFAQFSITYFF